LFYKDIDEVLLRSPGILANVAKILVYH